MNQTLTNILTNPNVLVLWGLFVVGSLTVLIIDLQEKNAEIGGLMKWVWIFTVTYSGPIGLIIYFYSGRKQIAHDSLWRRAFRSVAHCYSGCGAGEITGVFIAAGLLSLGNWWIAVITFTLAYVAGFTMTVGPLLQEGVGFSQAMWDAFFSETASITVMEVMAIGVDMWLAQDAKIVDTLFWSSLVVSLTIGLVAAYPVNVLLIHFGVKEGMMNPKALAKEA